jgi:glycine cleavage system H protein
MPEYLEATFDKFTFRVATDRLYSAQGLWVLPLPSERAGRVRVGLSDYLQQRSGDVAFVHVKPAGTSIAPGGELAEMETIKAILSLTSPVGGTVVESNPVLDPTPELVNQDPYDRGWLADLDAANWEAERSRLLEPQAYLASMRSQVEQELNPS